MIKKIALLFLKFSVQRPKCLIAICLFLGMNGLLFGQNSRQIVLFNDGWKFHKGDTLNAGQHITDNEWRQIDLPHDWSIEGPFDQKWASGTAYLPGGIGWYRKKFNILPALRNKRICIYFDGVYNNSEVWINGHYLGKRPNGFIPFQYELTKYLHSGENTISVKVDHSEFADSRWYTGSGIYRNVYLIAAGAVSIDLWGVNFFTPQVSAQDATAKVIVALTNGSSEDAEIIVKARILNPAGREVAAEQRSLGKIKTGTRVSADLSLHVSSPFLWSVDLPSLYTLQVSLFANGKETDNMTQHVGLRSFTFDKEKGFSLNGQTMKLKGVCIHDDAGALGVAVPAEAWERRLRILKDCGCNSLRLSHNPHADYLYDLCDKMGFLVMDEAFDEWEAGKNKWIEGWNEGKPGQDGYHQYFKEWANRDLRDMVLCHRVHPSIILWSIGNEIDYPNDPYTDPILDSGRNPQIYGKGFLPDHPAARRLAEIGKQLVAIVKQYDTTRPVTAALAGVVMSNEAGYPEVLDIVGYNYQEYRYPEDHKRYPDRIILGSENGKQSDAWNAVTTNDYISGQYLWTGVDYMGEARKWPARSSEAGLIDLAGFTKPGYYFRQSLWSEKPMVYISTLPAMAAVEGNNTVNNSRFGRNSIPSWNYTQGDSIRVDCFTNCAEAELYINGKSLGRKSLGSAKDKVIIWNVVYEPGDLLVKGYNNRKEAASFVLRTAGKPYALRAKADRNSFSLAGKQMTNVEIDILDEKGYPVNSAANEIAVDIEGPAKLLGLESGSSVSHEDYKSGKRTAFHGKLLAYIQSQQMPGIVTITISAEGLLSQQIVLDDH